MAQETKRLTLTLENVNAYYGESHILRNVSFTIEPGEVVCLMGRNGVGKTTTLKTLTGLLPVRGGKITFDGTEITHDRTDLRARKGLAYVPQGREIIPHLTVYQNLQLGYWNRPVISGDVSEKDAFDEVYQLFPKLTQILHRPGGVLSGGEQQQLAIGRAILSSPKLLLLDEPTEGIQPSIVDQIEDVIIGFKQSRRFAILLVEQGLHFAARLAEKYVIMAKGAVMAQGKSNELSADMVRQHLTV
ncbi:MAG: urea ABC transporter ATP-binding subunit UrtE [Nitrospira sp.]|jgi:urea transport system ATP-binding protein|nr:urea ABC transporter ATP-binding subunit UrtE [Nitrospira sp.]MDH4304844.1 urea ABC transporter ATP-binding subunit UrtE [Nitrospira sp.]MDH5194246.1 urea ABC transporter ATP-binding subunit UrtE [Nitrospira sp.]